MARKDIMCGFLKVMAGGPEQGAATRLRDSTPLVSGSWGRYEVRLPHSRFSLREAAREVEIDRDGTFENTRNEIIIDQNGKFSVLWSFSPSRHRL